jgi:hypothetical protein
MKTKYKAGSKFKLTADALENYGAQYADKAFTVTSVSTGLHASRRVLPARQA